MSSGDSLAGGPSPDNRRFGRVIDCGFVISENSAQWPTCKPLCREVHKSPESTQAGGARNKQSFTLNGGSGTHIDAPSHFVPGGRTVDQLLPEELANIRLEVLDVSDAVAADPDFACTASAILQHESCHGTIPSGSLVFLRTGWAASRYHCPPLYLNQTSKDDVDIALGIPRMHFPGFAPDAARLLVHDRGAIGIGVDTLSPDPGATSGFQVHHIILGTDRFILENLNLVDELPARGARAFVSPLNVARAPEAPARVWAILPLL